MGVQKGGKELTRASFRGWLGGLKRNLGKDKGNSNEAGVRGEGHGIKKKAKKRELKYRYRYLYVKKRSRSPGGGEPNAT